MLGNVRPYMPALSEEAKKRYNAFYCGLCRTLGRNNGFFTRFALNYDIVMVAMVYDDLMGEEYTAESRGCFANPFRKKDIIIPTAGTAFAADVLVMLAYFKLLDNIHDESLFMKLGCTAVLPYFFIKYLRAKKRHSNLAQALRRESIRQFDIEKNCCETDEAALPTSNMVKEIMLGCADSSNRFAAGQFGFFLGRVIYLIDALNDRKEDLAEGKFNIFNINSISDDAARAECFMALGEMAYWYRQIPLCSNREITDNIIYMSLARNIKFAGEEKEDNNG